MNVLRDGEILLYGTVGADFFGDGFSALDVAGALAELGRRSPVTARINSGGGDAIEGAAIYNQFAAHKGKVTMIIDSIAASAASVIAMAGAEIIMRKGSMMMIHDPSGVTLGTAADHEKSLEALETLATSMADIYAERSGKSLDDARADMVEEIWMTAEEAVSEGYADRVESASRARAVAAFPYSAYQHAPDRMVALASKHGWTLKAGVNKASGDAANEEDEDMPNEKKGGQTEAATPEFAAAVTAEVEKQLKARDDAAEAARVKAEAEKKTTATATVETPEEMQKRIRAEEQKRTADITAICNLAGQASKAAQFIADGKSLSEVTAALQEARAKGESPDKKQTAELGTSRGNGEQTEQADSSAIWKKATAKVNKRFNHNRDREAA